MAASKAVTSLLAFVMIFSCLRFAPIRPPLIAEWEARAAERSLEEGTEDYEQAAKAFCDEVSGR
jgi:hypothetical protein